MVSVFSTGCGLVGAFDEPDKDVTPTEPAASCTPEPCPVKPPQLAVENIIWSEEKASQRYFSGVAKFSEAQSTMCKPAEVCGVERALVWLTELSCDDGTMPFAGKAAAHSARIGNYGAGGRCGRIIDVYQVPCPEKTYEVHISIYHCTPKEERLVNASSL